MGIPNISAWTVSNAGEKINVKKKKWSRNNIIIGLCSAVNVLRDKDWFMFIENN